MKIKTNLRVRPEPALSTPALPLAELNPEGYTWGEWFAATGGKQFNVNMVDAWRRGEDPVDYRANRGAE